VAVLSQRRAMRSRNVEMAVSLARSAAAAVTVAAVS
jgi:hypothetical protein